MPASPQQFPQQGLPQVAGPAPPTQPAIPATGPRPPFSPLVYQARHDKHFGGGCAGQLTLSAAGLTFQCPDDPGANLQVALNEIGAVDENGVQLTSGKKYHFSISGMNKSAEQLLFTNWLHQVR
jgi:hypothetical protein